MEKDTQSEPCIASDIKIGDDSSGVRQSAQAETTRSQRESGTHDRGRVIQLHHQTTSSQPTDNTPQRSRKKEPKNVLTRIEKIKEGPLMVLKKALMEKRRVKVLIRSAVQVRSICTGYVIVFDRHMNMALSDVDEVYRNPLLCYKRDPEKRKLRKKEKKKHTGDDRFHSATSDNTRITCDPEYTITDPCLSYYLSSEGSGTTITIGHSSDPLETPGHASHLVPAGNKQFSAGMNLDGQYDSSTDEEKDKGRPHSASKRNIPIATHHVRHEERTSSHLVSVHKPGKSKHHEETSARKSDSHSGKYSQQTQDADNIKSRNKSSGHEKFTKSEHSSQDRKAGISSLKHDRSREHSTEKRDIEEVPSHHRHSTGRNGDHHQEYSSKTKHLQTHERLYESHVSSQQKSGKYTSSKSDKTKESRDTTEQISSSRQVPPNDLTNIKHLTERKKERSQAVDSVLQSDTEIGHSAEDLKKKLQRLCPQGRSTTTVADKNKPKDIPEVLKRHINKLFIRGDNVVMVVLED